MLRSLTTLALFLAIANHSAGSSLFDTWCFDQFGVPSGYTLRDGGHPERASLVQGFELADDTLLSLPKNLNLSAGVNETVTVPTQCFVDGAVPFGAGVGELNFTICSADRTEEDMLLICLAACAKVDGCDAVHYHGFDSGSALCRLHELAPDYPYCTEFPLRMECDTVRRADGELSGFICPDAPADPSKYDSPLGSTVQLTKAPSVGKKWKIGGYMYIDLSVTCTADDPNEDLQVAFAEALELHVPNAINASVECGEDSGNSTEIVYWLYSWTDTIVDTIDNDISTWLDSVITDVASSLNLSSVPVVTETSASTWTFEGFRESEVLEYPTCLGTDGTVAGLPINPWNAALVFKDLQFYPESHAPLVNFYRSMSRKNTDFFPIPEGCFSDTTGGTESNPALAQGGAHYILLGEDCVGNRTQEDMIRICMSICAQIDYGGPGTRDDRCWGVNFDEFEWGGHCHLLSSASNPMQYNAVCAGVTAFDRSTENRAGVCTARAALVSSDAPRAPFHSPAYPRSNLGQAFPRSNLGRLTPPPHTYLRPVSRRALIHHWPVASSLPCPAQTARESCSTHLHTADCGMKNFISIFCHVPDFSHAAGPLTSVKCALGTTWEGEECVTVGAGNYTRPGPYPGRSDALPRPNDFPGLINVEAPCPVGHYCPGGTGCGFGADLSVCPDTCSTIVQHEMFPDRCVHPLHHRIV